MITSITRFFSFLLFFFLCSCHSSTKNPIQTSTTDSTNQQVNGTEYQEFAKNFTVTKLPYNLPGSAQANPGKEIDKKFIKDLFSIKFSPALNEDDGLPEMIDNLETSKFYASTRLKLDSFDAYIIHKQSDDDYYFLCIFNQKGEFTDGTWISFTEGTADDGTVREAAISYDGTVEIMVSQYDVIKGKPEKDNSEHHFFEITSGGKIRDLKENSKPADS